MKICSIVGARPQFVKLAVMCRAVAKPKFRKRFCHGIIHTGQHYDAPLSSLLFEELGIPRPDHELGVGSGAHGEQTGEMMKVLEPILNAEKPDWVLLYGDTNSTLAGALVASKLMIRTAHIEAGLRSRRRGMPEEINRIVADHLSDCLFCPTARAMENLQREGLQHKAVLTGDVMCDALVWGRDLAERRRGQLVKRWLPREFALATVHRAENTDDAERLRSLVSALDRIARTAWPVVWPLHPRTKKRLRELNCATGSIDIIEPLSYLDMILLEGRARFILTDSGGVQKEAYLMQVPCITLRDETEWEETLENACNVLTGACEEKILAATRLVQHAGPWTPAYGTGHAGELILSAIDSSLTE